MAIYGMNEFERQILLNQSVIIAFLHGAFLDRISSANENAFRGLYSCLQITNGMLDADMKLKESWRKQEADDD